MQPIIQNNLEQIRLVLKAHSVSTAEVFGSALRNDFNDKSDIDLLVTFSDSIELLEYADNYFSLKESLEKLLDRSVDLISSKSFKILFSSRRSTSQNKGFMQHRTLKYVLDIEQVIKEIESFKASVENDYRKYQTEVVVKRAVERDLEIIGEAVRKMLETKPELSISGSKKIIGLPNLIAHAYDTVEDELIQSIIQKDIPILRQEIESLKKSL